MSSNNHRAFDFPSDLGNAQDYDPTVFPLARMQKKGTLKTAMLFISTSSREIGLIRQVIQDPLEFKTIFGDVEYQCEMMKSQGNELRERSKSWNPRKRLEAYRLIKLFNQAGFRLYIVTMRKSESVRQLHLPSISSENIISVTANEVSPTEPASGILVIVDSDVDIDQAGSDMTDAVNEPMSTPDLQESPDGDSSDAVSIAPSGSSYFTTVTSLETDQPNLSMIPPAPFNTHTSYTRSGVSPVDHRLPVSTPSLSSAIGSISPVNSPPMNPPPTSPPLTSPPQMSLPPTSPLPTGSPFTPTATSSPRGNLLPSGWNFQNSTIYFFLPQNDQRSYSGNGSNFSDINTGVMKTFPQDFIPTSPSN